MADKENVAPIPTVGSRLTRVVAKRAAAGSGGSSGTAKWQRVALGELPTNATVVLHPSPLHPAKTAKPAPMSDAEEEEEHADDGSKCAASADDEASSSGVGDSQLCGC